MSIDKYTLKDGSTRYRVSVYVNGERVAQKRGFKTKKAAKDYEAMVRMKGARKSIKTYDDVECLYIQSLESIRQGATIYNIENILKNNVPESWRKRNIAAIKPEECQALVNNVSSRCKTGAYYAARVSDVFSFAAKMDMIEKSPFDKIMMPHVAEADVEKRWATWTPEQYATFLETSKEIGNIYAYPLFRTILYTGLRRGEPLGLEWSDFDYENAVISLTHSMGPGRDGKIIMKEPKNNSRRRIPIDQETADAIEALRPFSAGSKIFPVSYQTAYTWFRKIEKKAGLPHSRIHNMRYEHCSVLLQNGAYVKDVQRRLGHKSAQTTLDIYARANRDERKVLESLPKNHYTTHYNDR